MDTSRVARLHRNRDLKGAPIRTPSLSFRTELKAALIFGGVLAAGSASLALLLWNGGLDPESDLRIILSFALGLIAVCGLSSSLAFLIGLRHGLLLVALAALLTAVGAYLLSVDSLESLAKIVFASSMGLWVSLMLTSISQVLIISVLIILVDFWSVFFGPTKKMVESGGPWIDYFTLGLPVFGANAFSRLGVTDIIFFSLFLGCTLLWRLRRTATALAMAASFVATMVVGVNLEIGVPALPLLSLAFLLVNADLLFRRFLDEPDELRGRRSQGS